MQRVPSFNADLYVVAATVIPVFFVALMLPGGLLSRYAVWMRKAARHPGAKNLKHGEPSATRRLEIETSA